MNRDVALTWSYLHILNKRRYDALDEVFGGLEKALPLIGMPLLRELGQSEETARKTLLRYEEYDADAYYRTLESKGIRFLTIDDAEYPAQLRRTSDPPVFLYAMGDLSVLARPCIAVVGTREMSPYGKRVAFEHVPAYVTAGMTTVSGLALGIDTCVAEQTLRDAGKTVAVLGHGFATIYPPSNAKLARAIVDAGGLLLTEFPYDYPADLRTFPARNRIIAGLSLATVVLEAPADSGALHTADFAFEDGRPVFAVPGSVYDKNYEGCHKLIATDRARLVTMPDEVLRELGVIKSLRPREIPAYEPQTDDERTTYDMLTSLPQTVDDLVQRTGLSSPRLGVALTMMELAAGASAWNTSAAPARACA